MNSDTIQSILPDYLRQCLTTRNQRYMPLNLRKPNTYKRSDFLLDQSRKVFRIRMYWGYNVFIFPYFKLFNKET